MTNEQLQRLLELVHETLAPIAMCDDLTFERCQEIVEEAYGPLDDALALVRGSPEPLEQRIGPTEPDNDMVICPHCTSQFVAIPVNAQRRMEAPQSLPCECTTYCLHSGYPDAPLRRGYFCREKVNDQKVSERRCVCGVVVIPQGELRVEIGSTTTTHRLAGPCFQTPAQGASRDASSEFVCPKHGPVQQLTDSGDCPMCYQDRHAQRT